MKFQKLICLLLAALLCAGMLAACGASTNKVDGSYAGDPGALDTELSKPEEGTSVTLPESQKLIRTNLSITDICYAAGFHSSSYFAKEFKKYYQKTPKEYRLAFNS